MKQNEIIETVTNQIIKDLENGTPPWKRPWDGGLAFPRNLVSQKDYSGINIPWLWSVQAHKNYKSSQWLTFKQADSIGGKIKKGEKATHIIFFKPIKLEAQDDNGDDRFYRLLRVFPVFNLDQLEGLEKLKALEFAGDKRTEIERLDSAENLIVKSGAVIKFGGNRACYIPSKDEINMPEKELFHNQRAYYATALHELTHWTGHETRLDRLKERNREHYAYEELVAELGAAFLCRHSGLEYDTQHASYIESWLKALKDDKRMIFKASASAKKAYDLILDKAGLLPVVADESEVEETPIAETPAIVEPVKESIWTKLGFKVG